MARERNLIFFDRSLAGEVEGAAIGTGLSVGEWVRACVRRELARLEAEKLKGRK